MPALEPLAVSPREAAHFLSISKRTVSRLIRSRKIAARKLGIRTLVDVASLKTFYECSSSKQITPRCSLSRDRKDGDAMRDIEKQRARWRRYNTSPKGRDRAWRYRQTWKYQEGKARYVECRKE